MCFFIFIYQYDNVPQVPSSTLIFFVQFYKNTILPFCPKVKNMKNKAGADLLQ